MLEGSRHFYFPGGTLYSEYNYKNGDREGPYKIYYISGKLREKGDYKNDELTGTREIYQEDGTLLKSEIFICGSREGKSVWYKNGKKVTEVNFFGNDPVN
jgi:antitoxin component YwqK of YwqJK toxin-antitoxin module